MSEKAFNPDQVQRGPKISPEEKAAIRAKNEAKLAAEREERLRDLPPKSDASPSPERPRNSAYDGIVANMHDGRIHVTKAEMDAMLLAEHSKEVRDMMESQAKPPASKERKQTPAQPVKKSWLARLLGR